jgi:hypothetical protein
MTAEISQQTKESQAYQLPLILVLVVGCGLMGWVCWKVASQHFDGRLAPIVQLDREIIEINDQKGIATIANKSDVTVRIAGYERSCSCISTSDRFPFDLAPHKEHKFHFTVDGKKELNSGAYVGSVVFFVNQGVGQLAAKLVIGDQ